MEQAVVELTATLEKAGGEAGLISGMIEDLSKAIDGLEVNIKGEVPGSYTDYQKETFEHCKAMSSDTQDMLLKSSSNPGELAQCSRLVTDSYSCMVDSARKALATTDSLELATVLKKSVTDLGEACKDLVYAGASVQGNPKDGLSKKDLSDSIRDVTQKISSVVKGIQAGAVGTQACNDAISAIGGMVGDLETTSMFCTAGALNSDSQQTFAEICQSILETAKSLVDNTKALVNSAASSQEALAEAAQKAVKTISKEVDYVKLGAAALGSDDIEGQLLLLTAAKDVANALGDLIGSTRTASGKSVQDPAMEKLKTSAKEMVSKVSTLLKTMKNVEDVSSKGIQSLENTIDAIEAGLTDYVDPNKPPESKVNPEELIRSTKSITLASAKAVAAGKSCKQADVSACANLGRKAVGELLRACKGGATIAENDSDRDRILAAGRETAEAFKRLLELVHSTVQKPTADNKGKLGPFSKEVADSIRELVAAAENIRADWVDAKDPNVKAETELLQAAASIEAAAKKLAELKPRKTAEADEELNFEEQILEAAKSIAAATSALVKSASAAQKELVAQGKLSSNPTSEDGQWSEGLVSAAKLVASATSNLCEAANVVVQGNAQEEKLIVAAKAVAASTAQLLISCQVKADTNSESNRRLQVAGAAVKKATETLVNAARQSVTEADEASSAKVKVKGKVMQDFRRELEAQEELEKKMREVERAKEMLSKIRRERAKR